jgi:DNA-binding MarR family transcriptional regulator
MQTSTEECAHEVLEVVPLVMRIVRTEMRRGRATGISVPQFRTLLFLERQPGASLTAVAEYLGLTLPSMSALVEGLVERKLVDRSAAASDRRRVTLALTARGQSTLAAARQATLAQLAKKLAELSPAGRAAVVQGLETLRVLFARA